MIPPEPTSRILHPISTAELERRWVAVRARMRADGIDALLVQSSDDWMGGVVRWFTDQPATNGYPRSVIFPVDGLMTVIEVGPFGGEESSDGRDPRYRGVGRRVFTPSFNGSVEYTGGYDADLAVNEIRRSGFRTVGFVNAKSMFHGFVAGVTEGLPGVAFVDPTGWIDALKAVKSDEEIALVRATAAMQDRIMAALREYIRPGLKEFEVAAHAQYLAQLAGAQQGLYLCSSAPPGTPTPQMPKFMQSREIERGDVVGLLLECNGPGGFYAHIYRIHVLGPAPQELLDGYATVVEGTEHTVRLMQPGALCAEIFEAHTTFMASRGVPEDRRILCHGQGYEMVERPLIRRDEPMRLQANMNLGIHPVISNRHHFISNTDNYLIGAEQPERLHSTPQQVFQIG